MAKKDKEFDLGSYIEENLSESVAYKEQEYITMPSAS